ncbi:hypothetical protein NDU88_003785 [Pleurodeles waltl]|uniref:Myb/SANT-like DNA-binding domain-containing protein n=1 Tax=Pleurodeles waltl TaxID=8319 RepID=A0AAV7UE93_PLEWA|nr:hypothetical protein NDU88_003785 [Pleurodeles waltl]
MVEEIIRVEPQLFGAQMQQISIARKMALWRRIVDRVNAVGQYPRTRDDIRKTWNDLRGQERPVVGCSDYTRSDSGAPTSAERVAKGYSQRPSKEGYKACHRQGRADPGVYGRRSTHSRKQWEDRRCWARKTAEAQLGMASPSNSDPPGGPHRILAVAYPELDGGLRASQQTQGGEYSAHHYNLRLVV